MSNITALPASRTSGGNRTVATNVRVHLAIANVTQAELAAAIGMNAMGMSRRMNDQTEFNASEIVAIADYFGITPGELFTERRNNTKKAPTPKGEGLDRSHLSESNRRPIHYKWHDSGVAEIVPADDDEDDGAPLAPVIAIGSAR